MQPGFWLGADELYPDAVVSPPAYLAPIGNAVERHIEQEAIGNPGFERYLQFGATFVLIAQRATDFRIRNSGDDRSALEHARTMLALGLVGLVRNWICRVRHR